MGEECYPQSYPLKTLTVGQLIEKLIGLDPNAPVIFQSPSFGCYGADQQYVVEGANPVHMPRRERVYPGGTRFDEETGEWAIYAPETQVWNEWRGVVIT